MAQKAHGPVIGDGSLHVGDRVVYPNQGICKITGVEVKQIAGQEWEVVTMSREEDGATVMVPKAKVMGIGLRKVAQADEIDKVFDMLAEPGNDPQLDWKVRHRENAERLSGGGLFGTVEVLKGLNSLARIRPLPAKERELYDSSRHLLVVEIAAAMSIPVHVAEDNLDYALWPPEGMKRKGKVLPAATLGPPPPSAKLAGEDDDLGFDDEETPAEPETPAAPAAEEGEEEEAPAPAPAPKPAATKPPPPAKPSKAPPPKAEKKPEPEKKHEPEKKAAPAKKPAAKKAAAPPKKEKAAPAKKAAHPAAKKAAPAKKAKAKK